MIDAETKSDLTGPACAASELRPDRIFRLVGPSSTANMTTICLARQWRTVRCAAAELFCDAGKEGGRDAHTSKSGPPSARTYVLYDVRRNLQY